MKFPNYLTNHKKLEKILQYCIKIGLAAVIILFAFWLEKIATHNEFVKIIAAKFGYAGTFVVAFISGFNLIIPVPAVSFVPLLVASGLNKWGLIAVLTLGMTAADAAACLLGKKFRERLEIRMEKKIAHYKEIHDRHHWAPLAILFLVASVAPLPNEVLVIPLAVIGYSAKQIVPPVFFGNMIFNYLSAQGIMTLAGLI